MQNLFPGCPIIDGTCYVADYTEATHSQRGVEISLIPFDDISFFTLYKQGRGNIPYQAINLEHFPNFVKGIDNCECIFNALSNSGKPWLLFLETKYCHKPENIDNYTAKAYNQMLETLDKVVANSGIDEKKRRIYFVYSVPPFSEAEPFGEFALSQNMMLQTLEHRGIILMGYNSMLIQTPQYLFAPKRSI